MRAKVKKQKFLVISIHDFGSSMKLNDELTITYMLKDYQMKDCEEVETFLSPGLHLSTGMAEGRIYKTPYRQLVGAFFHLGRSARPVTVFALG